MMKKPKNNLSQEIENTIEFALKYLTYRPRSIFEMREYLAKKGFNQDMVNHAVDILIKKGFLDDGIFTRNFIEYRKNNKPKSKFALAYELRKKGVAHDIIETALQNYNDQNIALKTLESKIQLWAHLDSDAFNKKIFNFLKYRGFNYDISISLLNKLKQSIQKT